VTRRSTFLANPAWVNTPWKGYSKSIDQELLDLVAEMANIGEAGYFPKHPENPILLVAELLDVVKQCWALDSKLDIFFMKLQEQESGPLFSAIQRTGCPPLSDKNQAFPITYQFANLMICHTCILYWTTCAILWSGLVKIYQVLNGLQLLMQGLATSLTPVSLPEVIPSFQNTQSPGSIPTSSPESSDYTSPSPNLAFLPPTLQLPDLGYRVDIATMGMNICQAIPYYQTNLVKSGAPITAAVFPVKVAIEVFSGMQGYEKELEWAVRNFETIKGSGAKLLDHLEVELTDKVYLSA
jgi:hypothetical protein